ncbi:MAG TPA: hypothetical protein VGL68_03305 [Solirubrobacteraceae bacterium]
MRPVLASGLLVLVVAFAVLLTHAEPRRSGTDYTPNANFAAKLNPGQQTCQAHELLPADTAAVRMTIGTYGAPGSRVSVSLTGLRGEALTAGSLAPGWRQGVVEIPVAHVHVASGDATACLRNDGPSRIAVAGDSGDSFHTMQVAGRTIQNAQVLYEYMRPGSESWLQLLPTAVYRSTLGKSGLVRHWAWAGALALMGLAIGLALRTIMREGAEA